MNREYRIEDLTEEEAVYIGEKINEIVPREVGADEEKFVFKVENENGEIVGGCIAEAYEYHWSRMFLNTLWVDERYRHHGIGSMIIREMERIAKEKALWQGSRPAALFSILTAFCRYNRRTSDIRRRISA